MPVPESRAVWGLPAASSVKARFAARAPMALGWNRTETVHVLPDGTVVPVQVSSLRAKLLTSPVNATAETVRGPARSLRSWTTFGAVAVWNGEEPKSDVEGLRVTGAMAVPESGTDCVPPRASSAICRLAVLGPRAP